MNGKPVLGNYPQQWRELMVGRQLPIIPASGPPGNPEATPECDAMCSGAVIVLRNSDGEGRLPDRVGYEP